jgi:hypothetical protein
MQISRRIVTTPAHPAKSAQTKARAMPITGI